MKYLISRRFLLLAALAAGMFFFSSCTAEEIEIPASKHSPGGSGFVFDTTCYYDTIEMK